MRTPRPGQVRPRGFATLIGNGWLREAPPAGVAPRLFDIRNKSALRKCMLMQLPPELQQMGRGQIVSAAMPVRPPPPAAPVPIPDVRRDPRHHVRAMAAVNPADIARAAGRGLAREPSSWWEDPVAIGALLLFAPPIGLAVLWSSPRYSNDARWALTVTTALTMSLVSAVMIVLALR